MRNFWNFLLIILLLVPLKTRADDLCLDGICIGTNVENLNVEWKEVVLSYEDRRFIENELSGRNINELYYDYNESIVASKDLLKDLAPFIIRKQQFDKKVLDKLKQARAICSSLALTGEVVHDGDYQLFVTFRAVADAGQRGLLRVVRIEKQYNVMAPHLRPADASKYRVIKKSLKETYPSLAVVRDIDSRTSSDISRKSSALLGFRFFSTVSNPLILRLIDPENIEMIEYDKNASSHCGSQ
ncbi:hypothetical protein [Pleionea sediminis]|uniref:hypothetical protein n=1 Tax=Pleionea sediminis TaxID=2569479 RepID=UPI001185120E|nr:hypothetical protein [Pleionea sediminis]